MTQDPNARLYDELSNLRPYWAMGTNVVSRRTNQTVEVCETPAQAQLVADGFNAVAALAWRGTREG